MHQVQSLSPLGAARFNLSGEAPPIPTLRMAEQSSDPYSLPLTVAPQTEWITRPLDEPQPALMDVPNLFMPVNLLRLKPDGTTLSLRANCWLYVFQDDYLWREVRLPANGMSYLMDVNLGKHAYQDQRPARCLAGQFLTLPYRINGRNPQYRIAFSEVQWSWQQIQALGGLHPQDPRNTEGEDLQTEQTLQTLQERTSILPLTDEDIEQNRTHVLTGTSQLSCEAPQLDEASLQLPHLLINDPLQDARDLKAQQDELLALHNIGLQSLQQGQLGLAQMIRELTENGDPLNLVQHLADERYDQQLLDSWQQVEENLPNWLQTAEQQLLPCLQQPAFTLVLADYLQSADLQIKELGVTLFSQLVQHLVMPESLQWLYSLYDEEQATDHPEYALIRGENTEFNHWLVRRTNETDFAPINEEDDRLKGLDLADRMTLLALLPVTLNELVNKYAETVSQQQGLQLHRMMQRIGERFTKLTSLAVHSVTTELRQWWPEGGLSAANGYRYLPEGLTRALHQLRGLQTIQLLPESIDSLDTLLRELNSNRSIQGMSTQLLGTLLGINALFAFRKAAEYESAENNLSAATAFVSFTSYIMKQAQRLVPEPTQTQLSSETAAKQTHQAEQTAKKIIGTQKFVHGTRFTFTLRLLITAAPILETSLGIWQSIRGIRTGNTGVAVGGGLTAIGTLVVAASGLSAVTAVALLPFTFVLLGLGLVVVGSLLLVLSDHSWIEQLIRHGWFGSHPYRRDGLGFTWPGYFTPAEQQPLLLQALQQAGPGNFHNTLLRQPDLVPELYAINKLLFHFDAEIKVYNLHEDRYTPGLPRDLIPIPEYAIVELQVKLGSFAPVNTLLQGNLQLRTEQIPLTDCYVLEERDVNNINPPHTLRFLVQVPRRSIGYGIQGNIWLDPDGSGQMQIPEQPLQTQWQFNPALLNQPAHYDPRLFGGRIASMKQSQWTQIKQQAVLQPSLTAPTLLVDLPDGCERQSREDACYPALFAVESS